MIGTDYICSCKSNYHTITATTAPCIKICNNSKSENSKIQSHQSKYQTSHNPEGSLLGSPNCAYSLFVVPGDPPTSLNKCPTELFIKQYLSKLSFNLPTRSIISSLYSLTEPTKVWCFTIINI